jgi:hypothetical protein
VPAEFAIVDEAYPYVAQRLLCDDEPRLQAALRYMVRRPPSALSNRCPSSRQQPARCAHCKCDHGALRRWPRVCASSAVQSADVSSQRLCIYQARPSASIETLV